MSYPNLLKVTASKESIIISLCYGLFNIIILVFFFIVSLIKYLNPTKNSSYLYPYGYGLYARNIAIIIGIVIIIYSIILFFLVRKDHLNIRLTKRLLIPLLFISSMGFLVVSIKETRSLASYTTNINHYEIYDELLSEDMLLLSSYLPKKEEVTRYEYLLHLHSSIWGRFYQVSIYVETLYDENFYNNISTNELMNIKENINDSLLNDFVCYKYNINQEFSSKDNVISYLYIFFNKTENRIIYAVTNTKTDIFSKYNNNFYIGAFINRERNNPYFIYEN